MTAGAGRARATATVADELLRQGIHIAFGAGALLLRWLAPWQAVAFAALALLFNLLLLHPLTGRRLLRSSERERGYSWGVILYPAVVLVAILVFHRRLELAAAVWGLLAFGDGMAGFAGVAVGGPRLPWNPRKTWIGLVAFVMWGATASAFLLRWTQLAIIEPGPRGAAVGTHVGSSFLITSTQDAIVSQTTMLVAGCLVAALIAGVVESLETGIDDNITVGLVGGAVLYAVSLVEPSRWVEVSGTLQAGALQDAVVTGLLAVGAYAVRGVDRSGAIVGWLLGTLLFTFGGWRGPDPVVGGAGRRFRCVLRYGRRVADRFDRNGTRTGQRDVERHQHGCRRRRHLRDLPGVAVSVNGRAGPTNQSCRPTATRAGRMMRSPSR